MITELNTSIKKIKKKIFYRRLNTTKAANRVYYGLL